MAERGGNTKSGDLCGSNSKWKRRLDERADDALLRRRRCGLGAGDVWLAIASCFFVPPDRHKTLADSRRCCDLADEGGLGDKEGNG
jgi:hypothetical protein